MRTKSENRIRAFAARHLCKIRSFPTGLICCDAPSGRKFASCNAEYVTCGGECAKPDWDGAERFFREAIAGGYTKILK